VLPHKQDEQSQPHLDARFDVPDEDPKSFHLQLRMVMTFIYTLGMGTYYKSKS